MVRLIEESEGIAPVLIVGARCDSTENFLTARPSFTADACWGSCPRRTCPITGSSTKAPIYSGREAVSREVLLLGERIPFGNDLVFDAVNVEGFKLHVEICEDVWTPIPPSTYAALAGATVLANLSASNITIGKAEYRRNLCASQSGKCIAAYLYSAAGPGESTTDLAWDGHALIYENNELLPKRSGSRIRNRLSRQISTWNGWCRTGCAHQFQ